MPQNRRQGLLGQIERGLAPKKGATYGEILPFARGGEGEEEGLRFAMPSMIREPLQGATELLRGAGGELPVGKQLSPKATEAAMGLTGTSAATRAMRPATGGVELGMGGGRAAAPQIATETPSVTTPLLQELRQGGLRRTMKPQAIEQMLNRKGVSDFERTILSDTLEDYKTEFPNQKIDVEDFVIRAEGELMPLERQQSGNYAEYGIRNVDPDFDRRGLNFDISNFLATRGDFRQGRGAEVELDPSDPTDRMVLDGLPNTVRRENVRQDDGTYRVEANIRADEAQRIQDYVVNQLRSMPKSQRLGRPETNLYKSPKEEFQPKGRSSHFGGDEVFWTRTYDPSQDTRRVVEVQSDLYQDELPTMDEIRGSEREAQRANKLLQDLRSATDELAQRIERGEMSEDGEPVTGQLAGMAARNYTVDQLAAEVGKPELADRFDGVFGNRGSGGRFPSQDAEIAQALGMGEPTDPYQLPRLAARRMKEAGQKPFAMRKKNWWKRPIREEVKRAAQEGKKYLQFPTGDTAKQVEGWPEPPMLDDIESINNINEDIDNALSLILADEGGDGSEVPLQRTIERLSESRQDEFLGNVVPVLREALPALTLRDIFEMPADTVIDTVRGIVQQPREGGPPVDTPYLGIYNMYEKSMPKFLKKEYNAQRIEDERGNSWWQIEVPKSAAEEPIKESRVRQLQRQTRFG